MMLVFATSPPLGGEGRTSPPAPLQKGEGSVLIDGTPAIWSANVRDFDWIGFPFPGNYRFDSLWFQEGVHYSGGGWFETVFVQVRLDCTWVNANNIVFNPPYAGNSVPNYSSYGISFTPMVGNAIRIAGRPGGDSAFISMAELRVFGESDDPLPIELSYFSGRVTAQGTVELLWGTLSETNNYGFEVERDGMVLSFIAGYGTTSEPHDYIFIDRNPQRRFHSYRLKQIDLDGSVWWSHVVRVTLRPVAYR